MPKYILAIVFTLTLNLLVQAQGIKGKWMQIKTPNLISYPAINIVEITKDSTFSYDFNKLYGKERISITDDNTLIIKDSLKINFKVINANTIQQKINEEHNTFKFVRLLATKDRYHLVDSLENVTYKIHFNNETMIFTLGEKKSSDYAIIIDNPPIATDYTRIEKFGRTYFLCLYALNRLTYAFPIKEIRSNSFIIYGVPGYENDVIAEIFEQD